MTVSDPQTIPRPIKKPNWLKIRLNTSGDFHLVKESMKSRRLFTVCEEARCPNIFECWTRRTATILLLGATCTRHCRFCSVKSGNPQGIIDEQEAEKAAQTVRTMNLRYAVLTCVDRDDLADGGAAHLARTFSAIRTGNPDVIIEALVGDFRGNLASLKTILDAPINVYGHNIETIRRLTPHIRDRRATYDQSLRCLAEAKRLKPELPTKSSIMVGFGESKEEVIETMKDLRNIGVDFFTIGQYLQPTKMHTPVIAYVSPEQFAEYQRIGLDLGFLHVASGPLVRSSYRASEHFIETMLRSQSRRSLE